MKVDIPPAYSDFVTSLIRSGQYETEDAVVTAALKTLAAQELKRQVDAGIEQLERGEGIVLKGDHELHEFFERIKRGDE